MRRCRAQRDTADSPLATATEPDTPTTSSTAAQTTEPTATVTTPSRTVLDDENAVASLNAPAHIETTDTYQHATVTAIPDGKPSGSVTIGASAKGALFPASMPGLLADACDVTMEGTVQDVSVEFTFDGTGVIEPTVFYFREATQTLEALETASSGGVATAAATEPGTYVLLDRAVYEASFVWEDRFGIDDVYAGVEVVFVMDDSGSMRRSDPDNERLTVAAELIDRLPGGSRIGVVRVASEATALTAALTADRDEAKACLRDTQFLSNGNTALYGGIQQALTLLKDSRPFAQRVMIVLNDGFPTDFSLYDDTIAATLQNDVHSYCVTLGNERQNTIFSLFDFADAVDATHFTCETVDELQVVYEDIGRLVDLATDSDGDTIPDYYEDHMVAFNGVTVPLNKAETDTDDDGIPDNEEVSVELVVSDDGAHVLVKGMLLSDPSMADSDGDGEPDSSDAAPYNNSFYGEMTSEFASTRFWFTMDYTWFAEDNTVYNPELSRVSALFSAMSYAENSLSRLTDSTYTKESSAASLTEVLTYFGMEDAVSYSLSEDYTDNHLSEVVVGHRAFTANGEVKTVLAVVVRGTNGTIEEWSSNFDIGSIRKDTAEDEWTNTDHHKGFDITTNRIAAFVEQYIDDCGLHEDSLVYWVTGHSRGAAVANILGASLEAAQKTAFTYTFAAPNTTLASDAASYRTIFNIINEDDFVPCLPIADWGYSRYGVSTSGVSVKTSYETYWESFTGIFDYNPAELDSTVAALAALIPDGRDPREECYHLTCSCHGDGTSDNVTIKNSGMSESSREKAIAKIPKNALPVCIITRYDGGFVSGWDFEVCQTPAYFMQILAAFMAEEIDAYRFAVELNIAARYEDAKSALISVGLRGIKHPHYPETYYVLAENLTADAFK